MRRGAGRGGEADVYGGREDGVAGDDMACEDGREVGDCDAHGVCVRKG